MMTESTDKVAVGLLTGMEPRQGGWFRFAVNEPGKQYPIRVDTKKPEIIEQAKSLMGQSVKITFGEVQSENINPNNNQPYTNRYLNQIALAGQGDVSTTTTAQPAGGSTPPAQQGSVVEMDGMKMRPDQAKELRIMRECSAKLAVEMATAGLLPPEQQNVAGLVAASEAWVAYFTYGPSRFGVQAFNAAGVVEQAPPPPEEPAYTCEHCGAHSDADHSSGCPNDIPF
jgi:hypothetical protein